MASGWSGAGSKALSMPDGGVRSPFALMALNNAWANDRLIAACEGLSDADYAAHRTSFFPSLRSTLNHIHAVDRYYIDALTRGGLGPHAFYDAPDFASAEALRPAQAMLDQRLIRFCDGLEPGATAGFAVTDRGGTGDGRGAGGPPAAPPVPAPDPP